MTLDELGALFIFLINHLNEGVKNEIISNNEVNKLKLFKKF